MKCLSAEEIEKNYETFVRLCDTLGDRAPAVKKLIDHFGDRLAICPASAKISYHCCFVGGLVCHSLRVLANAMKLAKTYNEDLPKESIIISCLFHDIGKLGTLDDDYYVDQTNDYYRKIGNMYEYNKQIQYMNTSHRTLYLLQHFGIHLSSDEFLAILLCDGLSSEEMKSYTLHEPTLATIVHQADYWATISEKNEMDVALKENSSGD